MPIRTYILAAMLSLIVVSASGAQDANIAERRAGLVQAVKKDCLAPARVRKAKKPAPARRAKGSRVSAIQTSCA
jgi:hypothetical protein